jgi:hypothetical protein
LTNHQGQHNHAVGIDTRSIIKLIWDPCEDKPLPLNKSNLNKCCGVNAIFKEIYQAGLIEMKQKRVRHKTIINKENTLMKKRKTHKLLFDPDNSII